MMQLRAYLSGSRSNGRIPSKKVSLVGIYHVIMVNSSHLSKRLVSVTSYIESLGRFRMRMLYFQIVLEYLLPLVLAWDRTIFIIVLEDVCLMVLDAVDLLVLDDGLKVSHHALVLNVVVLICDFVNV